MAKKIDDPEYYINAFAEMQTADDLLPILNKAKQVLFGEKSIPFSIRQFNYFSISKNKSEHYKQSFIPKKNGGKRTIHAPVKGLKHLQACMNFVFQILFTPHKSATGFISGKSIVDNAKKHTSKGYVYNIDLKNFFPSIDQKRVWAVLLFPPFNLGDTPERKQIANRIAILCCAPIEFKLADGTKEIKNVLPQGAPTSPTLSNIIAQRLDRKLLGVAKKYQISYSRYADDITFSGNRNFCNKNSEVLLEIRRIIHEQNFIINEEKVRLQKQGYRQEVTGLIVNEKPNVQKRFIKQLRQWLYLWETYGHDRAYFFFLKDYLGDKGHVKNNSPSMHYVIGGKLDFLKMVKGLGDPVYLKLHKRYLGLVSADTNTFVDRIFEIWELYGIEEAKKYHYSIVGETKDFFSIAFASKLDSIRKERLLSLSMQEIKKVDTVNKNKITKITVAKKQKIEQPHKPKDVAEFLFHFRNKKNIGLKYLTHKWDATTELPMNYETVIKNASIEFSECKHKYVIPSELYAKIGEYILAKSEIKELGDNKFEILHPHFWYNVINEKNEIKRKNVYNGWSSDEMKTWTKENPYQDPNLDKYWTEELINPFKNSIEVRAKTLKKYFEDNINCIFKEDKKKLDVIDLDNSLNDARFFTDVPTFFEGVRDILKASKEHSKEPLIKILIPYPDSFSLNSKKQCKK